MSSGSLFVGISDLGLANDHMSSTMANYKSLRIARKSYLVGGTAASTAWNWRLNIGHMRLYLGFWRVPTVVSSISSRNTNNAERFLTLRP